MDGNGGFVQLSNHSQESRVSASVAEDETELFISFKLIVVHQENGAIFLPLTCRGKEGNVNDRWILEAVLKYSSSRIFSSSRNTPLLGSKSE